MFEKHKSSGVPLTIILAHGEINEKGELMIRAGNSIAYPFETYRQHIEAIDEAIRKVHMTKNAPSIILLASCTIEDGNFSIPPRPKSIVYYRKGVVGILRGTGEFTKSA